MLLKFLEEVITIVVGKQAEKIAGLLNSSKHVNEFLIAKKMDITINQTRNILYKLSNYGLVSSMRKKDKRKGWYTYFWKIEVLKSLEFLKQNILKKKEQIANQIKSRETKEFYVCERCNLEFNAENALLRDFTCNECGDVFTLKDNSKILREMRKHYNRFDKELKEVEKEIAIENEKLDKKRQKELKAIEKEKVLKRAAAAAKRKRTAKKKAKKPVKKKAVKKKKAAKKKATKKGPKKKSTKKKFSGSRKVTRKKVTKKKK